MEKTMITEIREIIKNCEEIQGGNESDYTKRCAMLSAYSLIRDIVERKEEDNWKK